MNKQDILQQFSQKISPNYQLRLSKESLIFCQRINTRCFGIGIGMTI